MAYTWQHMSDFLDRGRKKYERPAYDRGLRVVKENRWAYDTDIHIGWNHYGSIKPFVTWHSDGTQTIQAVKPNVNGWHPLSSMSVKLTIQRYSGIQVVQRNYKHYILDYDAPRTPSKIQGCRSCKQTGRVDSWCGYNICWNVEVDADVFYCPKHPDMNLEALVTGGLMRHIVPCVHNELNSHTVPGGQQCYSCSGSGKKEYGNKVAKMLWNGQPLRIRDKKVIHTPAPQSIIERMMADVVKTVS